MPVLRDRRREYENSHKLLGMCGKCRSQLLYGQDRCFRHWLFALLSKRGLTKGRLTKNNTRLRELLVASMFGRFQAIVGGFLQPVSDAQRLIDAMEIRARLGIGWAGEKGVRKTAAVIRNVEKKAMLIRKEQNGLDKSS